MRQVMGLTANTMGARCRMICEQHSQMRGQCSQHMNSQTARTHGDYSSELSPAHANGSSHCPLSGPCSPSLALALAQALTLSWDVWSQEPRGGPLTKPPPPLRAPTASRTQLACHHAEERCWRRQEMKGHATCRECDMGCRRPFDALSCLCWLASGWGRRRKDINTPDLCTGDSPGCSRQPRPPLPNSPTP